MSGPFAIDVSIPDTDNLLAESAERVGKVMTRTMSFENMLDKSDPGAGEEPLHRGPRGIGEGHGNFPDAATRGSPAINGGSGFLLQPVPEGFHQGRE